MSSWSAPVYPRRSRSRSPYRGYAGRPPYPDPYGGDPYRPEWDAYDRERWAGYERERGPYDYGRRGRSRSPDDGAGRKRRRSTSPWDRERYEPRPRYDDYDPHRGGFSPRRPFHPSRPTPQDPHTLDYPASLKQYAEWFRYFFPQQAAEEDSLDKQAEIEAGDGSRPRNGIRSKWEKYKKDFSSNQLYRMFDHHRKSPWFAEKYDPSPEFVKLRERLRSEGWKGRINTFVSDLEQGKFDPGQGDAESDSVSKEPASNGAFGENTDSAMGPAGTEDAPNVGDDYMPGEEEDGNENEGGKSVTNGRTSKNVRGDNRGEEFAVMPEGNQVMIRTIPPDIGRLKLEEACKIVPGFVYLALGDPLQKRNYYRAGWIKFKDDADMPAVMAELAEKKIEGFKLHLSHNLKPFTSRIRYAPEVASRPDRLTKDLASAKTLASLLEDEYDRVRRPPPRDYPPPPQDGSLEPNVQSESTEDALMVDSNLEQDPDEDAPKSRGSEAVERRIEKLISELKESGVVDVMSEREFEAKKDAIALDLYISYLRAAFNTCFYCAVVTDHVEELQRKCVKHVRKPMSKAMLEEMRAATLVTDDREARETETNGDRRDGDEEPTGEKPKVQEEKESGGGKFRDKDGTRAAIRWLEWFDSKIAVLINRDGVDPRDYGGKDYQEELVLAAEPYVRQEGEGKYRCKHCQKLFIASSFVEKHVANKHSELLKHLDDIPYFNDFAMDPHRIQPFTHAPTNIGGGGQQPPPQAFGLQAHSYPPPDYGRLPPPPHGYGAPMPPMGYWEYHQPAGYGSYPLPPRRLSDRISGYVKDQSEGSGLPIAPGLPAKPIGVDQASSNITRRGSGSRGSGPLPPPPANAKEDPRASAGKKVSYHDMDLVAEGDVELNY